MSKNKEPDGFSYENAILIDCILQIMDGAKVSELKARFTAQDWRHFQQEYNLAEEPSFPEKPTQDGQTISLQP